ncbi:MAG: Gfo/Idh/MocA family oxidoreductase [Planctomycetota bacterium]
MSRAIVVGARCANQGIGEYVARGFHEHGVEVAAIVGTRATTILETRETLRERYGIECDGFAMLDEALQRVRPDYVAICSPFQFHREQLRLVAEASAHCLCEKPMWWEDDMRAFTKQTEAVVDQFVEAGRYLGLVTQWPQTLATFDRLHPGVRSKPLTSFEMWMGPTKTGPRIVLDAAPHCLSLLEALAGVGHVVSPQADFATAGVLELRFGYVVDGRTISVRCHYTETPAPPRPAAYAINGHRVDRTIRQPGYQQFFQAQNREEALPDPLPQLIGSFLAQASSGTQPDKASLLAAMTNLHELRACAIAAIAP